MRSPLPGGAEEVVTPEIEAAVAIVIREADVSAIGGFRLSPIDQPPYGRALLQGQDADGRDEDHAGFSLGD